MNKHVGLLLLLAGLFKANGRDWYAAPNAQLAGDGSSANPWPLQIALTKSTFILPGDTLYLRGGSYRGPGFISSLSGASNNYVVVRSFPGEWPVITDGGVGRLVGSIGSATPYSTTTGVLISGSEFWSPGTIICVDSEQAQLNAKGNSPTNWTLVRGWSGTAPTTHTVGSEVKLRANFVDHSGSYVMFRDFEITGAASTNRVVNTTNYLGAGLNLSTSGHGNKAINLIIHNVGHPAIGFWSQGDGGEINGCVMWGNGIYDNDGTWIRGTSVYAQNDTGHVYLKNNIVFRNFTEGMQAYGTAASTKGFRFINNITMMNPNGFGLAVWNAEVPMLDNVMWTNYHGLDGQVWGYTSISNRGMSSVGNVLVHPPTLIIRNHLTGVFTNNTILFDRNAVGVDNGMMTFEYLTTNSSAMTMELDRNTYYNTNGDAYLFSYRTKDVTALASDTSGRLKWVDGTNSWSAWTGWDMHSTYVNGWPNDYLLVKAMVMDYDTNLANVVVINTTGQTNATLVLSGLGFAQGDQYILRDAQDYFHPITTGTYNNVAINLPLTLTNVAMINGTLTHYTNTHTNAKFPGLFNAFVLRRIAQGNRPAPVTGLRIVGP